MLITHALAENYTLFWTALADDWKSIFGDPTKFGFGAMTVIFDLILLFQQLLYRGKSKNTKEEEMTKEARKNEEGLLKLAGKFLSSYSYNMQANQCMTQFACMV